MNGDPFLHGDEDERFWGEDTEELGSMSADNDPEFSPVDDPAVLAKAQAVLDAKGVQATARGTQEPGQ